MRLNKKNAVIAAEANLVKRKALKEKAIKAHTKAEARLSKALEALSDEQRVELGIKTTSTVNFGGVQVDAEEVVQSEKGE